MIKLLLTSFAPLMIPAIAGTALLIIGAAMKQKRWLAWLCIGALAAGLYSLTRLETSGSMAVGQLFIFDPIGLFFIKILYAVAIVIALLGYCALDKSVDSREIFYGLLLFCLVGMATVVSTTHLAVFFLGLEIYSACLYVLIAFYANRSIGTEAAVKYLILSAVSSGFVLLGIALFYLGYGTLDLPGIAEAAAQSSDPILWLTGTLCLFVGVCFKLSLAPFHMWAPDVYQGAPTSVTALIATGSKVAIFGLVLRYLSLFNHSAEFTQILVVIVVASIIIGNLLALFQQNLKRLLAYSSIAHLGYAFVPLCVGAAWSASLIYLVTYVVTALTAFAVLLLSEGDSEEAGDLENYRGLGHRKPLYAAGLALSFFSLAGIPMTAGFIGKWSIFQSALAGEKYFLVAAVIIGAALGAYYYLRVVASLYFSEKQAGVGGWRPSPTLVIVVMVLLAKVLVIGLYPEPLLHQIKHVSPGEERYGATCCITGAGGHDHGSQPDH